MFNDPPTNVSAPGPSLAPRFDGRSTTTQKRQFGNPIDVQYVDPIVHVDNGGGLVLCQKHLLRMPDDDGFSVNPQFERTEGLD
jgi:hypothetical protein